MAFEAIVDNIGIITILFIPFLLSLFLIKKIKAEKYHKKGIIISILLSIILIILTPIIMQLNKDDSYSAYKLYYEIDAQEKNIEKFGLIKATLLDIDRTIFGFEEKIIIEVNNNHVENTNSLEENTEEPKEVTYNKLELNLEELQNSNDNNLKNIADYIQNTAPTNKNEYTGYFKDKNLIFSFINYRKRNGNNSR